MNSHLLAGQPADGAVPFRRPLDIMIVTSEAPPIVSGISTCIDRLATGLIARQHSVRVLSCAQIRRVAFGEWRLSFFVAHWPQIVRLLRHVDVVNVHGPVPTMSDAFLWLTSRLPSYARPAIVHTHPSPLAPPRGARPPPPSSPGPWPWGPRGSWPAPAFPPASIAAGTALRSGLFR